MDNVSNMIKIIKLLNNDEEEDVEEEDNHQDLKAEQQGNSESLM